MTMLLIAAAAAISVYLLSGFVFYVIAIARGENKIATKGPDMPASVQAKDEELRAWWDAQDKREERLRSFDGLDLVGDYLPSPAPADLAVILVHGYTGTGPTMKRYARLFRGLFACDILCPDLRGHGRSDGSYIGFGLHDARDLRAWIDRVIALKGPDVRIVLFGVSMGGAAVLTASGLDLPANVSCVVSDCAYSNARDELKHKLNVQFRLPSFPLLYALRPVAKLLAGYDIAEASPRDAVRRAAVPLLIIHGDADRFVPPRMAQEIYQAAAAPKELHIVAGAGHAESYQVEGQAYAETVAAFVRGALKKA